MNTQKPLLIALPGARGNFSHDTMFFLAVAARYFDVRRLEKPTDEEGNAAENSGTVWPNKGNPMKNLFVQNDPPRCPGPVQFINQCLATVPKETKYFLFSSSFGGRIVACMMSKEQRGPLFTGEDPALPYPPLGAIVFSYPLSNVKALDLLLNVDEAANILFFIGTRDGAFYSPNAGILEKAEYLRGVTGGALVQEIINKMACTDTCQVVEVTDGGHSLLAVGSRKQKATSAYVLGHMLDFAEAQLEGRALGARVGKYPWAEEEEEEEEEEEKAVSEEQQLQKKKGKREEKKEGDDETASVSAKKAKTGSERS